jgi:hypothetical protein
VANSLPINTLITGTINYQPNAAQGQNTSTGLLIGSSNVIDLVSRYRIYGTPAAVASDFGTLAPEYLGAIEYFQQTPQPSQLIIGRWAQTAASGQLVGGTLTAAQAAITTWQAITTGSVSFTVDSTPRALSALSFAGVYNLNGVASVIQTALVAAGATGATFVYNSSFNYFVLTSGTTGASSSVSFATATGTGSDISAMLAMTATSSGAYIAAGAIAESALTAVVLFDSIIGQQFYGLCVPSASDTDDVAIANYIEAGVNKHTYWITSNEAAMLTSTDTTSILHTLKSQGLRKSFVQYSSSNPYAVISAMAKAINIDYTGSATASILMYKSEPGVIPENLNSTQLGNLVGQFGNVFVQYNNGTAILQNGTMTSGDFADTILGTDAFFLGIQNALYNTLYTATTKIPQTDAGMAILGNAIAGVCRQFVRNGFLAPGVWTNPGFGTLLQNDFLPQGFYIYAPLVANQSLADRSARKSVSFQIGAKLAGAVQTVQFALTINL